jgi:hypothetical protein
VLLAGFGLIVALRPADYGRVFEGDHLSLVQALQGDEYHVGPTGIVELQHR